MSIHHLPFKMVFCPALLSINFTSKLRGRASSVSFSRQNATCSLRNCFNSIYKRITGPRVLNFPVSRVWFQYYESRNGTIHICI